MNKDLLNKLDIILSNMKLNSQNSKSGGELGYFGQPLNQVVDEIVYTKFIECLNEIREQFLRDSYEYNKCLSKMGESDNSVDLYRNNWFTKIIE